MKIQGWISGLIGLFLALIGLISLEPDVVFWTVFILGAGLFAVSIQLTKSKLIGWLLLHLSIWVLLMAWIPGFQSGALKLWGCLPTGIVILLLGLGSLRVPARYPAYEMKDQHT